MREVAGTLGSSDMIWAMLLDKRFGTTAVQDALASELPGTFRILEEDVSREDHYSAHVLYHCGATVGLAQLVAWSGQEPDVDVIWISPDCLRRAAALIPGDARTPSSSDGDR